MADDATTTITRPSKDLVSVWKRQESKAQQLFGWDVTTPAIAQSEGRGTKAYPFTSRAYALECLKYWMEVVRDGVPAAAKRSGGNTYFLSCVQIVAAAKTAADAQKGFSDSCLQWARGKTELDFWEKTGKALRAMFMASDTKLDSLVGSANIAFWEGAKTIAIQMGSLEFQVTAAEGWEAFKQGAAEGVQNVGEAAGNVLEAAGDAAGSVVGSFFKGLGFAGVAFAAIALMYFFH